MSSAENTPNKKGKTKKEKNDPMRFTEGLNFKAKLIGVEDVMEARGDKMCQDAMQRLKSAVKGSKQHKDRITINVSLEGLKILNAVSGAVNYTHPVHRISFISRDVSDHRAFGYVFGPGDGTHKFFGIKTEKPAEGVVLALRDLFQVVFELKKKEVENAKKLQEDSTAHDQNVTNEKGEEVKEPEEKQATEATEMAVGNLLNLEDQLESLQQGLNQMTTFSEAATVNSGTTDSFEAFFPEEPKASAAVFQNDPFTVVTQTVAPVTLAGSGNVTTQAVIPPPAPAVHIPTVNPYAAFQDLQQQNTFPAFTNQVTVTTTVPNQNIWSSGLTSAAVGSNQPGSNSFNTQQNFNGVSKSPVFFQPQVNRDPFSVTSAMPVIPQREFGTPSPAFNSSFPDHRVSPPVSSRDTSGISSPVFGPLFPERKVSPPLTTKNGFSASPAFGLPNPDQKPPQPMLRELSLNTSPEIRVQPDPFKDDPFFSSTPSVGMKQHMDLSTSTINASVTNPFDTSSVFEVNQNSSVTSQVALNTAFRAQQSSPFDVLTPQSAQANRSLSSSPSTSKPSKELFGDLLIGGLPLGNKATPATSNQTNPFGTTTGSPFPTGNQVQPPSQWQAFS